MFCSFLPCLSLFPNCFLPAGIMPLSSSSSSCCFVRAAVPVSFQHVRCSSCSLSDLVASHYSELPLAFILSCRFRRYAMFFLLVFVLFRPRRSYVFPFSTYVVVHAAFLIFLHQILQNYCRLFVFLVLIYLIILVWLVLVCSRTRYASISLVVP